MGVNFVVTRKGTSEHELHIVSGMSGWQNYWLVGARELDLEIVPHLADGSYSACFPSKDIPALVGELKRLRHWMVVRELDLHVGFIDRIIGVFGETDPAEFEYSFG